MTERLVAGVNGRVQGVGFRWFVARSARRLGLTGWVANQPDGSLRVVAEGAAAELDRLAEQLRVGPSGAQVDRVDIERSQATGEFEGFEIRAGSHGGD